MRRNLSIFGFEKNSFRNKIKLSIFLLLLLFLLSVSFRILSFKYGDGIYDFKTFYHLKPHSIDTLILGSSHAFEDINPAVLYQNNGIAAFDLCGGLQPLWDTYYFEKEALKTQKPKLIVLEGFCTTFSLEYADNSRIIKNVYGMKWSPDKVQALMVSSPKKDWSNYFLDFFQYHNRYTDLSSSDFLPFQGDKSKYADWKGFGENFSTMVYQKPDVSSVGKAGKMTDKNEHYYRAIIELAKKNNIPICIVISPYAGISEGDEAVFLQAANIAKGYSVPFYNYNLSYDKLGLNFSTDFADGNHLNYLGDAKFSEQLGDTLSSTFHLPDRRGNSSYLSWQRNAQDRNLRLSNFFLTNCSSLSQYMALLHSSGERYELVTIKEADSSVTNCTVAKGSQTYYKYQSGAISYSSVLSQWNSLSITDTGSILFNQSVYNPLTDGSTILVYDTRLQTLADVVAIDSSNKLTHLSS